MRLSRETLEARNKVLREQIAKLERINSEQFEMLHRSQLKVMQLESENAWLRGQTK